MDKAHSDRRFTVTKNGHRRTMEGRRTCMRLTEAEEVGLDGDRWKRNFLKEEAQRLKEWHVGEERTRGRRRPLPAWVYLEGFPGSNPLHK